MSGLHDVRVSHRDPAIAGEHPGLGDALERVVEAQQALLLRRVDLLLEEITHRAHGLVTFAIGVTLAAAAALAGWFLAIAGVIDVLDDHFARSPVEIGMGMLHVAAGLAFVFYYVRRPRTSDVPS